MPTMLGQDQCLALIQAAELMLSMMDSDHKDYQWTKLLLEHAIETLAEQKATLDAILAD